MDTLTDEIWQRPLEGRLLRGTTLEDEIRGDRRALVFVRHFG